MVFCNFPSWPKMSLLLLFADLTRQTPGKEIMGYIWQTPSIKTCKNKSYLLSCLFVLYLFKEIMMMKFKIKQDKPKRCYLMDIWNLNTENDKKKLSIILASFPSFLAWCLCTSYEIIDALGLVFLLCFVYSCNHESAQIDGSLKEEPKSSISLLL